MNPIDVDELQQNVIRFVQTIDECMAKWECTWTMDLEGMTSTGKKGKVKTFGVGNKFGDDLGVWATDAVLQSPDFVQAMRALQGVERMCLQHKKIPWGFLESYSKTDKGAEKRLVSVDAAVRYLAKEFDKNMQWEKTVQARVNQHLNPPVSSGKPSL